MRRLLPVVALLLAAPVATAQDMPLFTFLPANSRWEPTVADSLTPVARPPVEIPGLGQATAIAHSPDGGTLFAGADGGRAVWAFRVGENGRLSDPAAYCPLRLRRGEEKLTVTALTVDAAGRVYAATPDGIQVFDPTGRLCGVLALPAKGTPSELSWGGDDRNRLTVRVGDRRYSRPMTATGKK